MKQPIALPPAAEEILAALRGAGFLAYAVGGCVRDSLLGRTPHDWDICTAATPEEISRVFASRRRIETGKQHGTITVLWDGVPYEITAFRADGSYTDHRHPDQVVFVPTLREDLARRDFTINAMAYHPESGVADFFGGREDLEAGLVRCVGDPDTRFGEDALRMLRAMRFAAVYGFQVEAETACAIHRNAPLLRAVSAERISSELSRLLFGPGATALLLEFSDVLGLLIPPLGRCIGFPQNNPFHRYTVYEHMVRAAGCYAGRELAVKLALLLHDIGKPDCFTQSGGVGHFYHHAERSRELAEEILTSLRFDGATRRAAAELIRYHDSRIPPSPGAVRRWLNRLGPERFRQLLEVFDGDAGAQAEAPGARRRAETAALRAVLDTVLAQQQCFSLHDMQFSGADVLALGLREGKEVGAVLRTLLDRVLSGEVPNDHAALEREAAALIVAVQTPPASEQ